MPRIVRAEFLSYTNPRRNSDKLFNVFVIETDDGCYSCVSEYGRRGNNLVRDTLCAGATREFADSQMRHKLFAKRNHRETPYTDEPFGANYSQIAREYGYVASQNSNAESRTAGAQSARAQSKQNVVPFPVKTAAVQKPKEKPKPVGILNQEQMNSLEI